jgi:hypothetical protein
MSVIIERPLFLMCSKIASDKAQMKELLAIAISTPLNPKQQQQLATKIRQDASFLSRYGISPVDVSLTLTLTWPVVFPILSTSLLLIRFLPWWRITPPWQWNVY